MNVQNQCGYAHNGILRGLQNKEILLQDTAQMNLGTLCYVKLASHKTQILYDSTYMRYLKQSNAYKHEAELWLPEAQRKDK